MISLEGEKINNKTKRIVENVPMNDLKKKQSQAKKSMKSKKKEEFNTLNIRLIIR